MADPKQNNIIHIEEKVELLSKEVASLKDEVADLNKSIEGLLDAWKASRGLLLLIKWLAGVASGCAVIWAALHGGPGQNG